MAAAATTGSWERLGATTSVTGTSAATDSESISEQVRVQAFLELARQRFEVARTAEDKRRTEGLIDLKFRCGLQWDEVLKLKREQQGRPCLTINRIPGFLKHVTNALRQQRPEIKIDPVGNGADEEIAEIRQGLIRHILLNSHADVPFDTAFEQMTTSGLGWMRVVDAWDGFDKELFVEWVANPFSVYSDPSARRPDWSDAKWRFVVEDYSLEEFNAKYKNKQPVSADSFKSIGDHSASWYINGKVRVAEYFHVEEEDDVLCELPDGSTQLYSEMDPNLLESVVRTRPEKVEKVVWTLMTGVEILKERKWKGKIIPVIPVIGNQIELDGERILVGMVRYAREAQRMFNYAYSCFVEAIALAPKSPFIVEFDQLAEFKDIWASANTDPQAFLPYRMKTDQGLMAPPPQRQQAEPPVQAFVSALKLADENMKACFSIYDAALGQRGPQESGLAINARKIETDVATFDWIDNFTRALRLLGVVLNDLLPHYYSGKGRIVQIIREDLTKKSITLNMMHTNDDGKDVIYDLTKGKFAVLVSTGPTVMTRRQEQSRALLELAKVDPRLMSIAGPQVIKALDFPDKDVIAAQYEKAMPPQLQSKDDGEGPNLQALQQQNMQMQAMIQQMSQLLTEATDKKEFERMKQEYDTFREQMRQETALAVNAMKTGSDEAKFLNQRVFEEMERIRLSLEGFVTSVHTTPVPPPGGGQVPPQGTPGGGVGTAAPTQ